MSLEVYPNFDRQSPIVFAGLPYVNDGVTLVVCLIIREVGGQFTRQDYLWAQRLIHKERPPGVCAPGWLRSNDVRAIRTPARDRTPR